MKDWSKVIVPKDEDFGKEVKMPDECPKDCEEKLKNLKEKGQGHDRTLYGDDGRGGNVKDIEALKSCKTRFITRKGAIITTLSILSVVSGIVVTLSLYAVSIGRAESAARQKNTINIEVIQTELRSIKTTVNKVLENQEQLIMEHQRKIIDPLKLMKMIEDAVKKGNQP